MRSAFWARVASSARYHAEAAAQRLGVGDQPDVVVDDVGGQRSALDRELVAEEHVLTPGDQLFGQRLDAVEGEVPEPVVDRLGNEHRRRVRRLGRPGDLGQRDAVDAVRVIGGQRVADREAGVVTDHGEPLVAERVHQRDQVVRERAGVVSGRGLVGQADAALVDGDDREVLRQRRHHVAPGVPGLGPAMDQQQRRSLAADDGVQADVAGVDEAALEGVGEAGREIRAPATEPGPVGIEVFTTVSSWKS